MSIPCKHATGIAPGIIVDYFDAMAIPGTTRIQVSARWYNPTLGPITSDLSCKIDGIPYVIEAGKTINSNSYYPAPGYGLTKNWSGFLGQHTICPVPDTPSLCKTINAT